MVILQLRCFEQINSWLHNTLQTMRGLIERDTNVDTSVQYRQLASVCNSLGALIADWCQVISPE